MVNTTRSCLFGWWFTGSPHFTLQLSDMAMESPLQKLDMHWDFPLPRLTARGYIYIYLFIFTVLFLYMYVHYHTYHCSIEYLYNIQIGLQYCCSVYVYIYIYAFGIWTSCLSTNRSNDNAFIVGIDTNHTDYPDIIIQFKIDKVVIVLYCLVMFVLKHCGSMIVWIILL